MSYDRPSDAVVVGSGPNGLAAAIALARAGMTVTVFEKADTIGGGTRTEPLTLPGFLHDVCSAVHPLGAASPFLQTLPLQAYGLEWIHPEVQLAHPLPDGTAVLLHRNLLETAAGLGQDAANYRCLMEPLVRNWPALARDLLAPLHVPRHPLLVAGFGLRGVLSADFLGRQAFGTPSARALFAGMAAHSFLPLDTPLSAAFGLILATLGHVAGWPLAKGGSASITTAMASYFGSLGGKIVLSREITSLGELPPAPIAILDITPRQLLRMGGHSFKASYRRSLERYRYGPGVFKVDWALDGPIPWRAAGCRRAATVHVGGTAVQIAAGEREVWQRIHPELPFVLVVQPSLFDPSRAPAGKETAWAYCHVPNGSTADMTERIETQVERFAPGFRDLILARHTRTCEEYEQYNPNFIGGDINGGVQDLRQFLARPTLFSPYRTPLRGVYLCSSGTPPGGGVHGMCGFHAAMQALSDIGLGRNGHGR
ncbi:NAD(P)/FAD-dependent oxidoreductase [Geobacter sp. SVR]|uniref:phytoene desaturase family protein n=1 Tax=Geobacter sp. SVR TaxID=2495594 RepID=UPI00143EF599|nr:NAD(P)/FAD-dependent oxidoreductase [Geobacter sp. SVR]BCS54019.1 FAD-dependent oxidoreductase [Geobacter sp. SVR]GCF86200.1 FAD-dependent oxidoreductase [Geobacter sp. SVR]